MLSLVGGQRGGSAQGLAPEPFFLTESLRSQSRFHDPLEDSLFSHSGSVEGFRKWNTGSGRNSPTSTIAATTDSTVNAIAPDDCSQTTAVRSSRPITTQSLYPTTTYQTRRPNGIGSTQTIFKEHSSTSYYETQLPTLVTPRTQSPSGFMRRIRYAILEASLACSSKCLS